MTPIAARDETILTQNWATVADIECMLDDHLVFTHYLDPEVYLQQPHWIVVNTWFIDKNDKAFSTLLDSCGDRRVLDVYIIAKCEAVAGPQTLGSKNH